ncbi:MAG: class II fructose-1,6-bisphosphate aldolase [Candidatus Bathyarchaeota archaeon]|nr:class II fructose-1,6-bisphosphate aldolase [Candidatus Bathyarchaeum sp.]
MLVTNKEVLSVASAGGYAVGAFNINNMEILQAIIETAKEEKSPIIVSASPSAVKYAGLDYLVAMVKAAAKTNPDIPMTLHLDHGKDIETAQMCINGGFTSVMIDGSHLDFEGNIAMTKHVVEIARSKGVSVEAELGKLVSQEATAQGAEDPYTDPDNAKEFVDRTGVDSLAVAIGTSHGAYKFKGDVKLDFDRLKDIRRKVNVPLVLHGASGVPSWIVEKATKYGAELSGAKGIPDKHIKCAISLGIAKINIDTDLRLAFTGSVREVLVTSPKVYDPRKILGPAKENMKRVVQEKMRLFGSSGKAV